MIVAIRLKGTLLEDNREGFDMGMKTVELIASGYEWMCPECKKMYKEIEVPEFVECKKCGKLFKVEDYYHAMG